MGSIHRKIVKKYKSPSIHKKIKKIKKSVKTSKKRNHIADVIGIKSSLSSDTKLIAALTKLENYKRKKREKIHELHSEIDNIEMEIKTIYLPRLRDKKKELAEKLKDISKEVVKISKNKARKVHKSHKVHQIKKTKHKIPFVMKRKRVKKHKPKKLHLSIKKKSEYDISEKEKKHKNKITIKQKSIKKSKPKDSSQLTGFFKKLLPLKKDIAVEKGSKEELKMQALEKLQSLKGKQFSQSTFDDFVWIFKVFISHYFNIKYEFTHQELIDELKDVRRDIRDNISDLSREIVDINYYGEKLTKEKFLSLLNKTEKLIRNA